MELSRLRRCDHQVIWGQRRAGNGYFVPPATRGRQRMAGGVSRRLAACVGRVVVWLSRGAWRSAGERWSIHLMPGVSLSPCRTTDITTASAPIVKDSLSGGELGRKDQQRVSHRAYALRPEPGDKRFGSRAESGARMCAGRRGERRWSGPSGHQRRYYRGDGGLRVRGFYAAATLICRMLGAA